MLPGITVEEDWKQLKEKFKIAFNINRPVTGWQDCKLCAYFVLREALLIFKTSQVLRHTCKYQLIYARKKRTAVRVPSFTNLKKATLLRVAILYRIRLYRTVFVEIRIVTWLPKYSMNFTALFFVERLLTKFVWMSPVLNFAQSDRNVQNKAKSHLRHSVRYGCHCVHFHETQNCSKNLCKDMYRI